MGVTKNITILIGYVGQDAVLKENDNINKQLASCSLATNSHYRATNSPDLLTKTEWHRIVAYGKLASYLFLAGKKGNLLSVTGEIRYRSWEDASGQKHYSTEIKASDIGVVTRKEIDNISPDVQEELNNELNNKLDQFDYAADPSGNPSFDETEVLDEHDFFNNGLKIDMKNS